MNDTLPEAQKYLDELYKKFSGEEKIIMASGMYDATRDIIISSLPPNLSRKEMLTELFLRFYKDDFTEEQIKDILNHIDKNVQ